MVSDGYKALLDALNPVDASEDGEMEEMTIETSLPNPLAFIGIALDPHSLVAMDKIEEAVRQAAFLHGAAHIGGGDTPCKCPNGHENCDQHTLGEIAPIAGGMLHDFVGEMPGFLNTDGLRNLVAGMIHYWEIVSEALGGTEWNEDYQKD